MIISPPSAVYGQTSVIRIVFSIILAIPIAILLLVGLADGEPKIVPLAIAAGLLAFTAWLVIAIGKTKLSLHSEGVRRTSIFGVKEIEWKDVREYRYRLVPMYNGGGLLGAAIMAAASRSGSRGMNLFFQLIANDGTKIQVSTNFRDAKDAIGQILAQIHPAMEKRVREELDRGGATFGDLKLSRQSVQWKNKEPIALSTITKAEIKGTRLSIRKKDKMFDAISVACHRVPNVLLLLDTMDFLGVAKDRPAMIDPLARVR